MFNKYVLSFLLIILIGSNFSFGQSATISPDGILFQAVARDANGNAAVSRTVYAKVSILKSTATGPVEYAESFQVTSSAEGIFTIVIGKGTRTAGVSGLSAIDWANFVHYLNLQIAIAPTVPDPNWVAANQYVDLGTSQFWSVPYTLFATRAMYADSTSTITAILPSQKGGTGVNNNGNTISIANNLITRGVGDLTITTTAASNIIFPTSGTLSTLAGTETLTNKTLTSPALVGRPVTVTQDTATADSTIASTLFVSKKITALASTISASAGAKLNIADTAAMLSTYATLAGTQSLTNKTINGLTPTALATGFSIAGGTSSRTTLTVVGGSSISGVNTGDQTISLRGDVTGTGTGTFTTTVNSVGGVSSATIATLPGLVTANASSLNSKVNIADTAAMLLPYAIRSNTVTSINAEKTRATAAEALKVNIADTAAMLLPYAIRSNTVASINTVATNLANEIARATAADASTLNVADTALMLSPYAIRSNTIASINTVANNLSTETGRALAAEAGLQTDINTNTTNIATERTRALAAEALKINISDSAAMLLPYAIRSNTVASINAEKTRALAAEVLKVNITDTASMLSAYAVKANTIASINAVATNLSNETNRAIAAETTNATNITNEATRASNAEALKVNISDTAAMLTPYAIRSNTIASINAVASNLSSEITRATTAEAANTASITAETSRALTAETTLQTNINSSNASITAEKTRAIAAENTLQTNINTTNASLTAETSRALAAETTLQTNINSSNASITAEKTRAIAAETTLQTNINTTNASLTAETSRALAAETTLQTNINSTNSSLTAETSRALAAEAALSTRVTTNTNSITIHTADIALRATIASPSFTGTPTAPTATLGDNTNQIATTAFVTASTAAATPDASLTVKGKLQLANDLGGTASAPVVNSVGGISSSTISTLPTLIAANTASITAETNRAIAAETTLQSNITTTNASLTAETTRATTAEAANTASITAEKTRAIAAETTLQSNITSTNASLTAETTRATTAEAANTASITAEKTRAIAAETTLQSNINSTNASLTAETTRATTAEAANTASITAEKTRAIAAETTLQSNITSTNASLTAETTRATTAEAANTASITAETNRAIAAETTLQSNITTTNASLTAETTRATTAEAANTASITAETNRAIAAETTLQTNINANTSSITANIAAIALRATIASPSFTGTPTAPTPATGDNSSQIATTAFVTATTAAATPDATSSQKGKIQLAGDLGGTAASPTVVTVGGSTASNINAATVLANSATASNTANQIVKRDASGNFSAGVITADLLGTATNVTGVVLGANGGTGVANTGKTITLGGNINTGAGLTTTGTSGSSNASDITLKTTATTDITLPTTGTIATLAGVESLTNKTINGITPTAVANGFTIAGGVASKTLTVNNNATVSGNNTGDQTITLTGDLTGSGTGTFSTTLANSGVTAGSYGSATTVPTITVDAKGRVTNVANTTITGVSPVGSTMASGKIIVGNASNVASIVDMSGDVTIDNLGVTTIGTDKVTTSKVLNSNITYAKIQDVTTGKVLGRVSAGNGIVEEIGTTGTGTVVRAVSPTFTGAPQVPTAVVSSNDGTIANTQFVTRAIGNISASSVSGILPGSNGGTGVDNTGKTITLAGNLITSGAYSLTFTTTGTTNVTVPTSGTLATTADLASVAGGNFNGSQITGIVQGANGGTGIDNTGKTITLGGNITTGAALTTTGVSGSGSAITLRTSAASDVTLPTTGTIATLAGNETLTNKTIVASNNNISGLTNANLSGTAGITDANLATISTAGKVANTATTGTSSNTSNALVARDASGNFSAGIISAALNGNAATATKLATARSIYGNSFDGTADLGQVIASTYGGTGNAFTKFTGATSSEKTYTLPDANTTILTTNDLVTVAQGGTGTSTAAANTFFAGPSSGSNAAPAFRALTASDLPSGSGSYIANSTTQQANSNFNISANGVVGGTLTAGTLVKQGGTSSQFLKADGSVDSRSFATLTGTETLTNKTINGLTPTALGTGFSIAGGTISKTLTVGNNANVSGTNTGDITIGSGSENYVSLTNQVLTANAVDLSGTNATGILAAARFPAMTGDVTNTAGTVATLISNNAITSTKIADNAVTSTKIADNAVVSSKIATSAVTLDKIASISTQKLLGNKSNSAAAAPGEISIGTGLTLNPSTGELSATGTGGTVTTVNALSLTASGSTFTSTVSNASSTPVISLNIPLASVAGTTAGLISKTDYDAFNAKITANVAITGATKTKITYDANGLVTAGANATTADIAPSTNRNYVTDAQAGVLSNTSGTNTGDQTITLTGAVTGTGTGTFTTTLANNIVNSTNIVDGAIATNDIADGAVTYAKHQNITAGKLIGSVSASAAAPGEVTIGSGLSLSASGTLTASGSGGTVNAVGTISSTSNVNGAVISGSTIYLTAADANNGGVITTAAQTFSGAKTFSGTTTFNNDISVNGLSVGRGAFAIASNTAVGNTALSSVNNAGATNNTAIGYQASKSNTQRADNTAIGANTLRDNTAGIDNTAVGSGALATNISGYMNTAVGKGALSANLNGYGLTGIGWGTNAGADNLTNATAIGLLATVNASNTVQLGNTSVTNVNTSGTLTAGTVTYPNTHNGIANQVLSINASGTAYFTTPGAAGSTLTNGKFLLGNASNVGTEVSMSGDVSMTNTGVTSINAGVVTTTSLANAAVSYAKIQNITAGKLLGSVSASAAAPGEITIGSGLSLSSGTLTASGSGGTVTGTGTTGQIPYWTSTNGLASNANFTWDNSSKIAKIGEGVSHVDVNSYVNTVMTASPTFSVIGKINDATEQTLLRLKRVHNQGTSYAALYDFVSTGGSGNIAHLDIRLNTPDNTNYLNLLTLENQNGNVGVNNTAPAEKLDVVGNIKSSGVLKVGTVTYPNVHNSIANQVLSINASGTASFTTPTAAGSTLTNGKFLLGNASNVGTEVVMSGDVSMTNTGAATLTNTAVSAGSYGSSTAIPTFTVDAKGRLTAAGTVGIIAGVNSLNYTSTTSYAAGGTISGTSLTLAAADGTNPGLISTGAQTIAGAKTFSGTITAPLYASTPVTLTPAGTITWTPVSGLNANVTLNANSTLAFGATPPAGTTGTLIVNQPASGGPYTLTLPTVSGKTNKVLGSVSGTSITLSSTASARDIVSFYYDGNDFYWNVGLGYGLAQSVAASSIIGGVAGSMPYQSAANTTAFTAAGTAGQILTSGGTGSPVWLTTLPTANGGTGITSYAAGDILYGTASSTLAKLTAGTNGQVLTLSGGLPTWATSLTGSGTATYVPKFNGSTTILGNSSILDDGNSVYINSTSGAGGNELNVSSSNRLLPLTTGTTQTGGAIRVGNSGNEVMDFGTATSAGWIQVTDKTNLATNNSLQLNPNGGNVGIGLTATPTSRFQVNGDINAPIYASTPVSLTAGATITWTPLSGLNAGVTLNANSTLAFGATPPVGSSGTLVVTQPATGGPYTLALPTVSGKTNKVLGSSSGLNLSTAANATDVITFYYDGNTFYWNVGLGYGITQSINATGLAGGVAGAIPYQTGASATAFTAAGTTGQLLSSNGTSAPTWITPSYVDLTTAQTIAGNKTLSGSTTMNGALTISGTNVLTAGGTTFPTATGTAGQVLTLSAAGAATWSTTSSISGGTVNALPKYSSATAITPSAISDDGTTVSLGSSRTLTGANASVNTTGVVAATTAYSLVQADNGKVIYCANTGAATITIPSGLSAGFNCMIVQMAAGSVTIAAGSGTTVYNRSNYTKAGGQYAVVTVVSPASNVFITGGDMQ